MRDGRRRSFRQNGRRVFKEVCPMVAEHIRNHLGELDIPVETVKRMWLHQANLGMNQLISKTVLGRVPEADEAPAAAVAPAVASAPAVGFVVAVVDVAAAVPAIDPQQVCELIGRCLCGS